MNRFQSPHSLANTVVLLLTLSLIVGGIAFVSQIAEVLLLNRAESTGITAAAADANDTRQAIIGIVLGITFLVTGILFIAWFFRCYKNLLPLGVDRLRYSKGWAIGGWFVPILNLWVPKQLANDIWRGSEPTDDPRIIMSPKDPIPTFLTLWWISWLLIFLMNFRVRFSLETSDAPTLDNLQRDSQIQLLNIAVWAIADLLAIKVVRELTRRQEERAARLARASSQQIA